MQSCMARPDTAGGRNSHKRGQTELGRTLRLRLHVSCMHCPSVALPARAAAHRQQLAAEDANVAVDLCHAKQGRGKVVGGMMSSKSWQRHNWAATR